MNQLSSRSFRLSLSGPPDPPSILSGIELRRVFGKLREQYQFIVVDLPALSCVVDTSATTEFIDSYVLVIEWGRTNRDLVEQLLRSTPRFSKSILGAVLNKVDVKKMATYQPYLNGYYHFK